MNSKNPICHLLNYRLVLFVTLLPSQEVGDVEGVASQELVAATLGAVNGAISRIQEFLGENEKDAEVPSRLSLSPMLALGDVTPQPLSPKSPEVGPYAIVPYVAPPVSSMSPPSKVLGAKAKVNIQKANRNQDSEGMTKGPKAKVLAKAAKAKALAKAKASKALAKRNRAKAAAKAKAKAKAAKGSIATKDSQKSKRGRSSKVRVSQGSKAIDDEKAVKKQLHSVLWLIYFSRRCVFVSHEKPKRET